MNFYVGVTDYNWFDFLRQEPREDINFWKPSGQRFGAIRPGGFFLFKLRKPRHCIAGVGQFASQIQLRLPQAWEMFGPRNGAATYQQFASLIHRNRRADQNAAGPRCWKPTASGAPSRARKRCPCWTRRTSSPRLRLAPASSAVACCCAPICTRSSTSTTSP